MCAVVVTHNPDAAVLSQALRAVALQAERIVVVDNASRPELLASIRTLAADTGARVIASSTNRGVGWGHNAGIAWAREQGVRYVLLLDQDSTATPGMVATLKATYERLTGRERVAAVGPCAVDVHDGVKAPFVRLGFPLNRKYRCSEGGELVRADFLITSGTLVPLAVLDDIGAMDERLFIDNVDMEWCFRARHRGYALFGVCHARLLHRLGEGRLRLGRARTQGIAVHPPVRLYYMMRNRVLLYRLRHTPLVWILQDVIRLPIKTFIFAVLIPPRLTNLYFMGKGLWHGMRKHAGSYE